MNSLKRCKRFEILKYKESSKLILMTFLLISIVIIVLALILAYRFLFRKQRDNVLISEEKHLQFIQFLSNHIENHYKRQQDVPQEQRQRITIERKIGEAHSSRSQPYKQNTFKINVSPLNHVIKLDSTKNEVVVQPQITFEDLCKFTIQHGFIPAVVPGLLI